MRRLPVRAGRGPEATSDEVVPMTTLHCPLCGLRFRFASELDQHAREHCTSYELHVPPPRAVRRRGAGRPAEPTR